MFGCEGVNEFESFELSIMGTQFRLKAACPSKIDRQIISEILIDVDSSMSTYKYNSEISRVNALGPRNWYPISRDMLSILKTSIWVAQETEGAFDPTVGSLVEPLGFGGKNPTTSDLEWLKTKAKFGYEAIRIRLDPPSLRMIEPRRLDFSAIAKGFALDKVASVLFSQKCTNFLIFLGGEVRVRGRRDDGQLWRIAIESPIDGRPAGYLRLGNGAIASSGSYRNFRRIEEKRLSHLIDPRKDLVVKDLPALVTVILPSAELADAFATGLFIVGVSKGLQLANRYQIPAIFGIIENGELSWKMSKVLKESKDFELQ